MRRTRPISDAAELLGSRQEPVIALLTPPL
jgi:hypothetical protein